MKGVGVVINMLSGDSESVNVFNSAVGKRIADVKVVAGDFYEDSLLFSFEDGTRIRMFDDGQSCCESRYMNCDDDLDYFSGAVLLDAEIRDVEENVEEDEWGGVLESQFLIVKTDKGEFTVTNYNSHNGYYGGFWIAVREVE